MGDGAPPPRPKPCRYSALFADEDPDVHLGEAGLNHRKNKDSGVSVTRSGHVRLKRRVTRGDGARKNADEAGGRVSDGQGGGVWARSSSEEEDNEGQLGRGRASASPRKTVNGLSGNLLHRRNCHLCFSNHRPIYLQYVNHLVVVAVRNFRGRRMWVGEYG